VKHVRRWLINELAEMRRRPLWYQWRVVTVFAISHLPKETRIVIGRQLTRRLLRTWQLWLGWALGLVAGYESFFMLGSPLLKAPTVPGVLGLAAIYSITAFATLSTVCIPSFERNRRNVWLNHGICPDCGYDLRATPDRCPECGTIPAKIELKTEH
jgi:hypothetical protein